MPQKLTPVITLLPLLALAASALLAEVQSDDVRCKSIGGSLQSSANRAVCADNDYEALFNSIHTMTAISKMKAH